MIKLAVELEKNINSGQMLTEKEALAVLRSGGQDFTALLALADRVRRQNFSNKIHLCSIVNAKSGACSEDCAFCAQSAHHNTEVDIYGLRESEQLVEARENVAHLPVSHFGIVTSGPKPRAEELDKIIKVIESGELDGINWCASLGALNREELLRLKKAGLRRFHHNLETAPSFFPQICSTHDIAERIETVKTAAEIGLEVCCGGILGLGESKSQRVEFAFTLRELGVDSIPLNFLIPIPGTRLGDTEPLQPLEILRTIIMFRLVNPEAELKVCAGRENLRDLQSMIFYAGATGMMIGDLLTVAGRDEKSDLQMLNDLGFSYEIQ
ncbi:MAG: biotin synthase BioB [bacterium]